MKRRILIIALALAAVTAAIGTTVASLLPNDDVQVPVYVYTTSDTSGSLVQIGSFDLPITSSGVAIQVSNLTKSGTTTKVTRTARDASGNPYFAASAFVVDGNGITIP